MGTLRGCLVKIGLDEHEQAILRGLVKDYREDGYDANQAAIHAVNHYIDELEAEAADIHKQIIAQIGKPQKRQKVEKVSNETKPKLAISKPSSGLTRSEVSNAIAPVVDGWKNIPSVIKVVQGVDELPAHLRNYIKSINAESEAAGLYDPRSTYIYLVADNLKSVEHAQKVFLHEAFGHYGLAAITDEDQRVSLLNAVYEAKREQAKQIGRKYDLNLLTQRGRLEAAEEVLAHLAESGDTSNIFLRALSRVKQWIRKAFPNLKMTDAEIRGLLGRMARGAKSKTPKLSRVDPPAIGYSEPALKRDGAFLSRSGGESLSDVRSMKQAISDILSAKSGSVDGKAIIHQVNQKYNAWDKSVGTLLNLVRKNSGHPTEGPKLVNFFKANEDYAMDRDSLLMGTQEAMKDLMGLDKGQRELVGKALFEGTLFENSDGTMGTVWSAGELKKRGISDAGIEAYQAIRKYFEKNILETADRIIARTKADPKIIRQGTPEQKSAERERIGKKHFELAERIYADFRSLKGYFPLLRFGKHTLAVYDAKGDLTLFEMFENKLSMESRAGQLRRQYAKEFTIKTGKLDSHVDEEVVSDLRILSMLEQYSQIDPEILDEVEQKILKQFSDASFRKRFIHRKGVAGYSPDVVRTLARYGQSSAHFLSKLKHIPEMRDIAKSIDKRVMPDIRDHLLKQIEDIEKPGVGFAKFRQITFLAYMGLNFKSALVNLTQLPIVLYPHMAQKYGDVKAVSVIGKAMKLATLKKYSDPKLAEIMDWSDKQGLTWDNYLGEIAGFSRGKRSTRMLVENKAVEYATFMFSMMEMYNRRVAVISEYLANPKRDLDTLKEAVKFNVYDTQWLYGKGNQGRWFRSWGAVPLQFQQWIVQYLEFLTKHGHGGAAARSLGMVFLFGGLFALPGADDAKELIQFASNKLGKNFDIEFEARKLLVDMARQFVDDDSATRLAEYALRGHGAYLPGDISGSISMSRLVPGLSEFLRTSSTEGYQAGFARWMEAAMGPGPGLVRKAVTEVEHAERSGDWARAAEAVPIVALSNVLKSLRWELTGMDRDYAGKVRIAYEPETVDKVLQALSIQPSERSRLYRIKGAEMREGAFVEMVHDQLLTRLAVASVGNNADKRHDAMRLIQEWNRESPPEWRLTGEKIMRSMRARRKSMTMTDDTGTGSRLKQIQGKLREQREYYYSE